MSSFTDVKIENLSVKECDTIALNGGRLTHCYGYGYSRPRGSDLNLEYATKVVNKKGMGNHGFIILVGKTLRARKLIRIGKINLLLELGVRYCIAEAAIQVPRGMESDVVKLADDLLELCSHCRFDGKSHFSFEKWAGYSANMTFPRIVSAIRVAERAIENQRRVSNTNRGVHEKEL